MVHKTRKKPYHHVTYYHQWQSNRGVLEEKTEREQRFPDSPQISRKKKEFHVNQNEPSRLPSFGCSCGTWCAELILNDRWAWWTCIGWNTSHDAWPSADFNPHQGTSRLLLRVFTPTFLTSHEVWPAQTLTATRELAGYCWKRLRQHFRQNSTTAPSSDENMWKHARIMLMNVSTKPSKRIDSDSFCRTERKCASSLFITVCNGNITERNWWAAERMLIADDAMLQILCLRLG